MKYLLYFIVAFLPLSCTSQDTSGKVKLSIAPQVNRRENAPIITALESFLQTKNDSPSANRYWLLSDFTKFVHPYEGIYNIEDSKFGRNFYQPSLMEITNTKDTGRKIVKVGFVGHNATTGENIVKVIYNMVANIQGENVLFSSYIEHATRNWQVKKDGSITYCISPTKEFNPQEAKRQQQDIKTICDFFNCNTIPISYYSCIDPVEVFRIKGFDYNPMMYVSKTGGLAQPGNIIFSGNNSDYYTHEIVHLYVYNLFGEAPAFMNEGVATYFGGSGLHDFQWHKSKLREYLKTNSADFIALANNPFERLYIDDETPLAYVAGAIICEKIIREYGKEKLISLLSNKANLDIWNLLKQIGLTKQNLNSELLKSLQ